MNSRIALPTNRHDNLTKPVVYATWIQNVSLRQLAEENSSSSSADVKVHLQKSTRQNSAKDSNNNPSSNIQGKQMTPLRQTLLSFPSENIVKSYQTQYVIAQQQQSQLQLAYQIPRPPSLAYENKRMAYRYNNTISNKSKSVDEESAAHINYESSSNVIQEKLKTSSESLSDPTLPDLPKLMKQDREASSSSLRPNSASSSLLEYQPHPNPASHLSLQSAYHSQTGISLNKLQQTYSSQRKPLGAALTFPISSVNSQFSSNNSTSLTYPMRPNFDINAVECLSIRPLMRSNTNNNNNNNTSNHSISRKAEIYPYRDPLIKSTKSFISRLTEIALLTQNTIRNERKKKSNNTKKTSISDYK